jgi:hypothetical protein
MKSSNLRGSNILLDKSNRYDEYLGTSVVDSAGSGPFNISLTLFFHCYVKAIEKPLASAYPQMKMWSQEH